MTDGSTTAGGVRQLDSEARAPQPSGRGVLDRVGRWAALNPLKILALWFVLLGLAAVSSGHFASQITGQSNSVDGSDTAAADKLINRAFPDAPAETDFAVVHSAGRTAQDPDFRAVVERAVDQYRASSLVRAVSSPYDQPGQSISADGRTALVTVSLDGDDLERQDAAEPLRKIAAELTTDTVQVDFTGYSPLRAATIEQGNADVSRAEAIGFPVAALVLLIAFGSVVAAAIPLTLGFTAILASFGLLGLLAFLFEFSSIARMSVTMLAIALGIDYSLFILTRFREELAGTDPGSRVERAAAVGRALSTAGRAVLFSGATVIISLGGLFIVRSSSMRTMAVAMMAGVLAELALAMTLLPAILGLLGGRVNSLALPWARRSLAHPDPRRSGWARLTTAVMRRPVPVALGVAVVLAGLAAPALGLRFGVDDGSSAVRDSSAGRGLAVLSESFPPGMVSPVTVVAATGSGPLSGAQLDAIAEFTARVSGNDDAAGVVSVTSMLDQRLGGHGVDQLRAALAQSPDAFGTLVNAGADAVVMTVYPREAPDADSTRALVADLRADADELLGGVGLAPLVGGTPAEIVDIMAENSRATPLVVATVLVASGLLLLFVFRSVVLPLKAIAVNLLSVGAAFGIVVLVFQEGHGAGLIGVDRTGFIQVMLPLLTFAIAFGLSMDYEVFMVSRMREEWERNGDNPAAVRLGITHSARVITSAALIMVAVFASFVFASMLEAKELGFMLAVTVLLDATVVRIFLVPAVMRIIGPRNWWIPGWLDRLLPKYQIH